MPQAWPYARLPSRLPRVNCLHKLSPPVHGCNRHHRRITTASTAPLSGPHLQHGQLAGVTPATTKTRHVPLPRVVYCTCNVTPPGKLAPRCALRAVLVIHNVQRQSIGSRVHSHRELASRSITLSFCLRHSESCYGTPGLGASRLPSAAPGHLAREVVHARLVGGVVRRAPGPKPGWWWRRPAPGPGMALCSAPALSSRRAGGCGRARRESVQVQRPEQHPSSPEALGRRPRKRRRERCHQASLLTCRCRGQVQSFRRKEARLAIV